MSDDDKNAIPAIVTVQSVDEVLAVGVEVGTRVYHVPPGQLVVGANARGDVPDDPEFAASIREHGVLQAISCYVRDGQLVVEMGQRRTVFATRVGLASVPVVVGPPPDEVRRLVEQVTENEHRTPLTTADRAGAVQQLSLLGLTAEQLVRRTRLPRVDVDHALAIAASPAATAAAAELPITLGQAAAIAEFDDEPDVVERLTLASSSAGFDHVVELAREDRRDRDDQQRVLDGLREDGIRVVESDCVHDENVRTLEWLHGRPGRPFAHADCPGHAAFVRHGGHYVDGRWEHEWHAEFVCTQASLHAVPSTPQPARAASLADEQARQDRAQVLARNREWRTATIVRRRWLAEFARGRTAPAEAERWIAATLLLERSGLSNEGQGVLERALLGQHRLLRDLVRRPDEQPAAETDAERVAQREGDVDALLGQLGRGSPRAALRFTCALLLAAWEARADVHVWRHPTREHRHYLGQMIAWGYPPADVEQLVMQLDLTEGNGTSW